MDLAHPARSIAPSLDVVVLKVLALTTAPLPLVEVHRLGGTASLSGVRRTLRRLATTGLVLAVSGGYLLNRDHIAAPVVEAMAGLRSTLLGRIRDNVSTWRPRPALVGIFGSLARHEGDLDSDIDILVVREDATGRTSEDDAELSSIVRRWTGNDCHVVSLTIADLQRMRRVDEPILRSWHDDLLLVVGDMQALSADLPPLTDEPGDS